MNWQKPSVDLGNMTREGRNPDVECLAIALGELPIVADNFGSQEWKVGKFVVVKVGPPGFARVPYLSKAKDKDKPSLNDLKSLYEVNQDGDLQMSTFEKLSCLKDKGDRVDIMSNGEPGNAVVKSGTVLKFFVQRNKIATKIGDDGMLQCNDPTQCIMTLDEDCIGRSMISTGDFVVLNIRSKNCEQALKGSIVNVTKIKLLHRSDVASSDLYPFPKSLEQYQELKQFIGRQATLKECVEMDKGKYFCFMTSNEWFVNSQDFETTGSFTLSNGLEAYELPWKLVTEVMQCGPMLQCYRRARKVLELMMASGSVRVVVSMPGDVLFSDKDKPRVLDFNVDYSKFLCLDSMRALERNGEIESERINGVFRKETSEDGDEYLTVVAELKQNKVVVGSETRNMIVCVDTRKCTEKVETWQEQMEEDFPMGGLRPMPISLMPPPGESYKMSLCSKAREDFEVSGWEGVDKHHKEISCHAHVWWRPVVSAGGSGSACGKRAREEMSDDEM